MPATTTMPDAALGHAPLEGAAPPEPLKKAPPRAVVAAVLGLRRALIGLADRLVPELALIEDTVGVIRTRVLGAVAEQRLADALAAGSASAEQLAERLELDADSVHRVLRAASLLGAVTLDEQGVFTLTKAGELLRSDHPNSISPWVRYLNQESTQRAYEALPGTIRSGEPSFQAVYGESLWDYFAAHPNEEQLFADAMRRFSRGEAPTVAAAYEWPAERRRL